MEVLSMTRNLPKYNYSGEFNYFGEVWKGKTIATSEQHAFSKLVVGLAKHCNTTGYFVRQYFLTHPIRYEIRKEKQA